MKQLSISSIFCMVGMLFCACEKTIPDPITVVSVDQDFEVFPWQGLNPEGSQFQLVVRSVELDSCLNAFLDADLQITGDKISININGNQVLGDCERGEIFTEKTFTIPSEPKTYIIEFKKSDLVSTSGTLEVSETEFNLNIENLGGVFILESTLLKIEPNFVWGYFAEKTEIAGTPLLLFEVKSEFESILPSFFLPESGNYGHFEVLDNGNVLIKDLKGEVEPAAYELSEEAYWNKFVEGLMSYASAKPNLKYSFTRWDGLKLEN
jgi:hypothetical protein